MVILSSFLNTLLLFRHWWQDSKLAGQSVSFLGTFPNDQLGAVMEEIDVLVVPSRWYENTPLVMQSALATLTPLIVTDLGGMSELVKHGENGLLFKLNDYQSLLQQLTAVLEDRDLLPKFASNIKPERTVGQMVDDIESVYEEVLTVRR
jgi:glycosyltransferase involved in cell wall biosynthesis